MALLVAASLLEPNVGLIIWKALAFGALLALLSKFAWGPITRALEERETKIEDSLTRAEQALAEAARLQADNDVARRDAERQSQAILRDAKEQADAQRATDLEKTKVEIARMQAQAASDIELQKQRALSELRSEVATLAIGAAEKILRETMDEPRQRALVDQFITDLPRN